MDKADLTVFLCFAVTILAVLGAFVNLVFGDRVQMLAGISYGI